MKIIEMNPGTKISYELHGTKLSFADGALALDLARYQRDSTVTKDIMVDSEGNLTTGRGDYYAAQVEIPPTEYEETVITATEREDGREDAEGGTTGSRDTVQRTPIPLNTDDVTLKLFAIDGIVIY